PFGPADSIRRPGTAARRHRHTSCEPFHKDRPHYPMNARRSQLPAGAARTLGRWSTHEAAAMIADVTSGLSQWWAPALAFAAGVVSFASPCVFPLVPGYLAFVSGGERGARR